MAPKPYHIRSGSGTVPLSCPHTTRIPCPPGPLLKVAAPSPWSSHPIWLITLTGRRNISAALVLPTSGSSSFETLNAKALVGVASDEHPAAPLPEVVLVWHKTSTTQHAAHP
jgi:hypothetical protein